MHDAESQRILAAIRANRVRIQTLLDLLKSGRVG